MHVIESRFFEVTVERKKEVDFLSNRYYIVQAATAEEAAQKASQFGEVVNVFARGTVTVLLKGDN